MVQCQSFMKVPVIWSGKKLVIEINSEASLKELGGELQTLTNVKADTIRLIIPKSSSLLMPFSDEHSNLTLQDIGIMEGKPLRMMGVSENEINNLHKDAKQNLRIVGFEEEEKRMKQRISRSSVSLKLPNGPYIFCDFRTLELPGVTLNPPPSEALKRMHMLAADPGIVAIMNKHRWRVGIMTEMAPVGYVGVSPKCVLGFNKNHGEEISLRLRTDDLKGFRKYESIKKTLLHELAHMVFSEHDANFYALDKQLNQEAFALDWTKSKGHTLANTQSFTHDDMDLDFDSVSNLPHKLGGESSFMLAGARIASVAAAYNRLANSYTISREESSEIHEGETHRIPTLENQDMVEPDPDDHVGRIGVLEGAYVENLDCNEPDPDDVAMANSEPDPDDMESRQNIGNIVTSKRNNENFGEQLKENRVQVEPDLAVCLDRSGMIKIEMEPDPDDDQENYEGESRGDLDRKVENVPPVSDVMADEPDPDVELRRIQDPATLSFNRLNKAIELLRTELNSSEAMLVLQTLFKIIRNVSENPNEMKYKRLRKGNPVLQRNIANYPAAMEILSLIGFNEEVITVESGNTESYIVLKRNDPGLLWLAKSSLESSIAV